ncbi:GPI anchored protein [Colletotrichum tofieldiae]|nr:GPI anchored protein [Colletotrichum tofieldiae]
MTRILLPLLALTSLATAHFSLSIPKPLGDSDDKQGTAPCGGYTPSSSSETVDFHVEGDATGLGNFCEPQIVVPSNFTGQKGIIGIVAHSPDGLLYACSAVNFVSGAAPTRSECKNATITADFTSDPSLTALIDAGSAPASSTPSSSGSPASSASTTPNAAPRMAGNLFSVGAAAGVFASVAAAVGGAAMLF